MGMFLSMHNGSQVDRIVMVDDCISSNDFLQKIFAYDPTSRIS
jgi:hypothetical protein